MYIYNYNNERFIVTTVQLSLHTSPIEHADICMVDAMYDLCQKQTPVVVHVIISSIAQLRTVRVHYTQN